MTRGILPALMALLLVLLTAHELSAAEYGTAARVNGVDISLFRLERHFEDYLREQRRSVAQIRNPSVYKRLKREALEQLIEKELLWQEALRLSIEVGDAEVERTRTQVAAGFSSPAAYERRLQQAGFDADGYADYLRREIAVGRVLERLVPGVTVSDEEVRSAQQALRTQLQPGEDDERQRDLVRQLLLEQRSAEARRAVIERLRAAARIERLLPL